MDRREFLSWTSVGWLAASLPMAIAACSSATSEDTANDSQEPTAASNSTDTDSTNVASENLASADDGFISLQQPASNITDGGSVGVTDSNIVPEKVVVIRDPADANALLAFTSNCNHRGCTVDWNADAREFICPCHGSRFGLDGTIVPNSNSPATQPLRPLEARVGANDVIEVKF